MECNGRTRRTDGFRRDHTFIFICHACATSDACRKCYVHLRNRGDGHAAADTDTGGHCNAACDADTTCNAGTDSYADRWQQPDARTGSRKREQTAGGRSAEWRMVCL